MIKINNIVGISLIILTAYHFYLGSCLRAFKDDRNTLGSKYFRIINEIPTILLILIIFFAILKPLGGWNILNLYYINLIKSLISPNENPRT